MIRPARVDEDADAVAPVLIESRRVFLPFAPSAHSDSDVCSWVRTTLLPTYRVVVWEENWTVVAVLATSEEPSCSWIDQLYVLPGWNRKNIGSRLLEHSHCVLPRPIRLYTFQQNTDARRFYEHHGYSSIAFTDGQANEEKWPDVLMEYAHYYGPQPLAQEEHQR